MLLYEGSTARVAGHDGLSDPFAVTSGVLQGDTLSPSLFVAVLDLVNRLVLADNPDSGFLIKARSGPRDVERRIFEMTFADDTVYVCQSIEEAQRVLNSANSRAAEGGLSLNLQKTKFLMLGDLAARRDISLAVNGTPIARVEDFKYLGSMIATTEADIQARIKSAHFAFSQMKALWRANLSEKASAKIFKLTIEPILFYGCEAWTLTDVLRKKLTVCWYKLLRWITNTPPLSRVRNLDLAARCELAPPEKVLRERFLQFAGHAFREQASTFSNGEPGTPLSNIMTWDGQAKPQYTAANGHTLTRLAQRQGQGNKLTYLGYCASLLGVDKKSQTDLGATLSALAANRENWKLISTWRQDAHAVR
jgi:Reverse transcriptase (RNA-dependent DNA polymerase)